jgi:hypothetical protein
MKKVGIVAILAGLASAALAQEHKDFPKPGREHALLKQQFEGDWDAYSKSTHDGKMEESKGTETVKSSFGGYWLACDFRGEMNGKSYTGQGTLGYDPYKKKYVMTWIDSMSPYAMWAEGEADAQGKTFTFTSEGYCPDLGKATKFHLVMDVQDSNHRTLTFYRPGKDGREEKMGEIFYTRHSS